MNESSRRGGGSGGSGDGVVYVRLLTGVVETVDDLPLYPKHGDAYFVRSAQEEHGTTYVFTRQGWMKDSPELCHAQTLFGSPGSITCHPLTSPTHAAEAPEA